jgi:uncharacterized protein YodC (DUF2158 family)
MEEEKFKIGDIVQLNSGGLPMTVNNIIEEFIYCWWHSKDGILMKEKFNKDMIKLEQANSVSLKLDLTNMSMSTPTMLFVNDEKNEK